MTDVEKAIEVVKARIIYHADETKYRYEIGKDILDICAEDIVKDLALCEKAERSKGCEYCNPHKQHLKHIQDSATLYKLKGEGKKAPYITAELLTGGDKAQGIRIESASADAVNRGFFEINFCPMCGRPLKGGE